MWVVQVIAGSPALALFVASRLFDKACACCALAFVWALPKGDFPRATKMAVRLIVTGCTGAPRWHDPAFEFRDKPKDDEDDHG